MKDAVLIWDDAESLIEYVEHYTTLIGRDPAELLWFNPTGRANRHQRISLPARNRETYRGIVEAVAAL